MAIRVMLVDDQALFREGLETLLAVWDDIEVVAQAGDGRQGVELAVQLRPQVILMDLRMPIMDGVAATRILQERLPEARVIVLTTFDDDEDIFQAIRAGAVGYLLKDVSSQRLVEAIRVTAQGGSFLQPNIASKLMAEFARLSNQTPDPNQKLVEPLSERELEVLEALVAGASNREIANALHITEGTVKNHVSNILGKLGVRDRTQAALKARDLGLM